MSLWALFAVLFLQLTYIVKDLTTFPFFKTPRHYFALYHFIFLLCTNTVGNNNFTFFWLKSIINEEWKLNRKGTKKMFAKVPQDRLQLNLP